MGIFQTLERAANSAVLGPIWRNFKLTRTLMVVLITWKNEEDPIKNEGARVLTTLNIIVLDGQGQLTLQSVVGYGRMSNSSVLLWLS